MFIARLFLFSAIVSEVFGIIMMKESNGFKELLPTILMAVSFIITFLSFSFCIKRMEVSISYAIWAAFGAILSTVAGIFLYGEIMTLPIMICLILIIFGVIILSL